jgi:hypothetical protein
MDNIKRIWEPIEMKEDVCYLWQFSRTLLTVMKNKNTWYLGTEDLPEGEKRWLFAEACAEVPDREWIKFFSGDEHRLQLTPVMPDKPLVILLESPGKLLPKQNISLYFEIPLWIRISSITEKKSELLYELPIENLSNIWFGDPLEGELCYSLTLPLIENPEMMTNSPCTAVCTVNIKNQSALQLDLQKFLLHSEYLFLFESEQAICTDEVLYQFRGAEQSSQISFSKRPPGYIKDAELLSNPREPHVRNIIKRSFSMLKYFTAT